MLGWRKLSAWLLVFGLSAVVSLKLVAGGAVTDVPPNAVDLVKWVTGFFFGANAVEHLAGRLSVNVGKPPQ